jgi:hypothetical protein
MYPSNVPIKSDGVFSLRVIAFKFLMSTEATTVIKYSGISPAIIPASLVQTPINNIYL